MSDYSQITFFTPKDGLATGNPNKIIYGSDVDAELSAISTAIASKADVDGDAIGAGTPATEINVDNLKLDANKIISTNTDGDIELEPNGAGYVVITNVDVAAGEIDGTVIGGNSAAAGTFTTLNATTVDSTNLEVTNLKAKDGTAAGSIADVTGVVTLASSVLTTTDINGGTVDGTVIGGNSAAAITGTTLKANTSLELATGATVTAILDEDTMTSDSATALATQQSIKAYVDAQVTAQDLDVTTDSGTIAIDLDSETLTVAGGTGLDTSAAGNTVTVAIDSTVATLTGTQTLTNKTLTSPDINTPDIDGGTIDGATIATSDVTVGAGKTLDVSAGTLTLANDQISGDKIEGGTIGSVTITTADINGGTLDGVTIGGSSAGAGTFTNLTATGTTTLAGASTSADITFGDNDKAVFGAGSDLEIYHDGSNSYITDSGTGNLRIQGATLVQITDPAFTSYSATFSPSGAAQLYYNNALKLSTEATGIDVTGTITTDGLTVDKQTLASSGSIDINGTGDGSIRFYNSAGSVDQRKMDLRYTAAAGFEGLYIRAINDANNDFDNIARFDTKTGDISFYEDTGTTAKFFWDASAEALGIGTSSPSYKIHVLSSSDPAFFDSTGTNKKVYIQETSDGNSNTGLSIRKKHSTLHPAGYWYGDIRFQGWDGSAYRSAGLIECVAEGTPSASNMPGNLRFSTNGGAADPSERMRIDSSGNLLVGKTTTTGSYKLDLSGNARVDGGYLYANRTSGVSGYFDRLSTDGDIVEFRKGGSTVGSIGTEGGDLTIGTGDTGLKFNDAAGLISPWDMSANAPEDAAIDLGYTTGRFKNLYLSGGVYLGGTGAANQLDDYEEGTWTPTLNSGTLSASATYTKVGRLVTLNFNLANFSDTSSATTIQVSGLPFNEASGTTHIGSAAGERTDYNAPVILLSSNYMRFNNGFGVSDFATDLKYSDINNGPDLNIIGSITYYTD